MIGPSSRTQESILSPLPLTIEEISAEWLSAALSNWTPRTRVAAIEEMNVIRGTATKILLRLRYDEKPPNGPPERLCLKAGFDEALRAIVGEAYCSEAGFYAHVARLLDVPTPRCWFALAEPVRGQGIVILDDLADAGARFGEPTEPWPLERVAAGLDAMSQWHGPTWAATRAQFPWLPEVCALRQPTPWLLGADNWKRTLSEPFGDRIPDSLRDPRRIERALFKLWAQDDSAVPCLAHLDPHIGNTYFGRDGQPRFLDWQVVHLAPGVDDVAYFIVGAMDVEERRRHERDLVRHYLDALHRHGGPRLAIESYWKDYRRHHLHGFLWVVTPPTMQPLARVQAMAQRHWSAMIDHETLPRVERD